MGNDRVSPLEVAARLKGDPIRVNQLCRHDFIMHLKQEWEVYAVVVKLGTGCTNVNLYRDCWRKTLTLDSKQNVIRTRKAPRGTWSGKIITEG